MSQLPPKLSKKKKLAFLAGMFGIPFALGVGTIANSSNIRGKLFEVISPVAEPYFRAKASEEGIPQSPLPEYQQPFANLIGNAVLPSRVPGMRFRPNFPPYCFEPTCFRINELGYKGRSWETPENKPSGDPKEVRILFLGDSMTYGFTPNGTPTIEFSQRVEEGLQEKDPSKTYKVFNVAVPMYSASESAGALHHFASSIKPDIVVFGLYTMNDNTRGADFYSQTIGQKFSGPDGRWDDKRTPDQITAADKSKENRRVTSFFDAGISGIMSNTYHSRLLPVLDTYHKGITVLGSDYGIRTEGLEKNTLPRYFGGMSSVAPVLSVEEMAEFCKKHGVEFYVVDIPFVRQEHPDDPYSIEEGMFGATDSIRKRNPQMQIIQPDVHEFERAGLENVIIGHYFPPNPAACDPHFNQTGHDIMGRILTQELRERSDTIKGYRDSSCYE